MDPSFSSIPLIILAAWVAIRLSLHELKVKRRTVAVTLMMHADGVSPQFVETNNSVLAIQSAIQKYAWARRIKAAEVTFALRFPSSKAIVMPADKAGDFWRATSGWVVALEITAANDSRASPPWVEFASSPWKTTRRAMLSFLAACARATRSHSPLLKRSVRIPSMNIKSIARSFTDIPQKIMVWRLLRECEQDLREGQKIIDSAERELRRIDNAESLRACTEPRAPRRKSAPSANQPL